MLCRRVPGSRDLPLEFSREPLAHEGAVCGRHLQGRHAARAQRERQVARERPLYTQLLGKVDTTIDKLNSGQGTLGQLMVNPQLYDSLKGVTNEMNALLKDVRANPKKFLRIKLAVF